MIKKGLFLISLLFTQLSLFGGPKKFFKVPCHDEILRRFKEGPNARLVDSVIATKAPEGYSPITYYKRPVCKASKHDYITTVKKIVARAVKKRLGKK